MGLLLSILLHSASSLNLVEVGEKVRSSSDEIDTLDTIQRMMCHGRSYFVTGIHRSEPSCPRSHLQLFFSSCIVDVVLGFFIDPPKTAIPQVLSLTSFCTDDALGLRDWSR